MTIPATGRDDDHSIPRNNLTTSFQILSAKLKCSVKCDANTYTLMNVDGGHSVIETINNNMHSTISVTVSSHHSSAGVYFKLTRRLLVASKISELDTTTWSSLFKISIIDNSNSLKFLRG